MTNNTAVLGPAGPDTAALDTVGWDATSQRDTRIEAVHQLLAAAWSATSSQPEPDGLRAIAADLVDGQAPIPAVPTPQAAHRRLAAALGAARQAHTQALAQRAAAEEAWQGFRTDVRRRAAQAVEADYICLEGTNEALREFDIDELRIEYRVELQVPVFVCVRAANTDDAYAAAEQEVRDQIYGEGLDFDAEDISAVGAQISEGGIDLDD